MRMHCHLFKSLILCSLLALSVSFCAGQGLVLTPIAGRNVPQTHSASVGPVAALSATPIVLPFFDDFTSTAGYPDTLRWVENQVWINNNFPIGPPNYNVATFDHLDKNGKPYKNTLNKFEKGFADSLTSQPIKLDFYQVGAGTQNYLTTDEIYLSFFLQQQGLGDLPENGDSLVLFFLTKTNGWKRVWGITGSKRDTFSPVIIPIDQAEYLHGTFQFRFVNFTKFTGNLNHWHIDYVRVEKYKGKQPDQFDLYNIHDVGIVKPSYTMFKNYFSLPYSHFKTDISGQILSKNTVTVRNMNLKSTTTNEVNTGFACEIRDQSNVLVASVPFSAVNRNIKDNSDSTIHFLQLDTFTAPFPEFSVTYKIDPKSHDGTPTAYNAIGDNNSITVKHRYTPWYAYDDGSAEGGFGLDYAFLGNIKGQFAMRFNNLKDDSLRGLAVYFNRSESDVSTRTFSFCVWKSLSPVGAPDNKDVMLYEFPMDKPIYTDSMNKFVYIFFDTVLILPKGEYYVGWKQKQPFILNVGYDNNYRYNGEEVGNPNLFHDLLGSWEHADYSVKGVPMIRPLFGMEKDYTFNNRNVVIPEIKVYPNPTAERVYWDAKFSTRCARLYDITGQLVLQVKEPGNSLNLDGLKGGSYTLQLQLTNGQIVSKRVIKN